MTDPHLTEEERSWDAHPVIEEPDADAEEVDLSDREPKDGHIIVDDQQDHVEEPPFDPDAPEASGGGRGVR